MSLFDSLGRLESDRLQTLSLHYLPTLRPHAFDAFQRHILKRSVSQAASRASRGGKSLGSQ
eukprot:3826296-Rhodomonas_salina.1